MKLLILALVLLVVWSFFKVRRKPAHRQKPEQPSQKAPTAAINFCPVCGVYVAGGATPCGKDNCPI